MILRNSGAVFFRIVKAVNITVIFSLLILINSGCKKEKDMNANAEFWGLVEKIENLRPYTKNTVENIVNCELAADSEPRSFSRYTLKSIGNNAFPFLITGIDLRIRESDPSDEGLLVIKVADSAISIEDVLARYPKGTPVPAPPENTSSTAERSYWVQQKWGKLVFGFSVHDNKLGSIAFQPGKENPN